MPPNDTGYHGASCRVPPRATEFRRTKRHAAERQPPSATTYRNQRCQGRLCHVLPSTAALPRALAAAERRCMPPSTAVCHRAPPSVAAAHATERRHAAAGSAHRRALRSANVEDREMGAVLCARSRRGRTTVRVCAATNPPSSIPPFSPTDRSRYATLKADQVPGDNCCGCVTTEVVSRHGSRPGCNPRRQGGDNFWT
jgi:hypothetical protein